MKRPLSVSPRVSAFTLVELLIGLFILAVLLGLFARFFGDTLGYTSRLNARNELLGEGQIAQNYLSSKLQEAWYVFPSGTSITLPVAGSVATWQVTAPSGGGTAWTVDDDGTTATLNPFIALILPPSNGAAACVSPSTTAGCYRFLAYYPITRSSYVTNTASSYSDRLLADPQNGGARVLMQYSAFLTDAYVEGNLISSSGLTNRLPFANAATAASGLGTGIFGQRATLVADYLDDADVFVVRATTRDIDPAVANTVTVTDRSVTVNLVFERATRGKTYTVGGTGSTLQTTVSSRNQNLPAP